MIEYTNKIYAKNMENIGSTGPTTCSGKLKYENRSKYMLKICKIYEIQAQRGGRPVAAPPPLGRLPKAACISYIFHIVNIYFDLFSYFSLPEQVVGPVLPIFSIFCCIYFICVFYHRLQIAFCIFSVFFYF